MKNKVKTLIKYMGCLIMLLGLFGCGKKNNEEITNNSDVKTPEQTLQFSFTSRIEEADIWIIPDTQENRKTTLWGSTTIKALAQDATAEAALSDLSEDGKYLLRVIDHDSMYYSADAVEIPEGGSMELKKLDGPMSAELEVFDADGASIATYEVFMGRL